MVEEVSAYLKSRNIGLEAVVPVPDKSRVESADLCGVDRPAAYRTAGSPISRPSCNRPGSASSSICCGPMNATDGERYYRTDTHWNERGASGSGRCRCRRRAARGGDLAPTQKAEFRVSTEPERERVGDLIRLAGLDQSAVSAAAARRRRGRERHRAIGRGQCRPARRDAGARS
jgi:alginate O-acetyltransferase complex protein AlgJ